MICRTLQEDSAVRVMLRGGLGNQLFGWAAGFSLATKLGLSLELDTKRIKWGDYQQMDPRKYELGVFQAKAKASHLRVDLPSSLREKKVRLQHPPGCRVFREASFEFDRRFDLIEEPSCLEGYFQSWRYFGDASSKIKSVVSDALSKTPMTDFAEQNLFSEGWIAVHIRKGDYTRIGSMAEVPIEYYRNAVNELLRSNPSMHVVTISQSATAARRTLPGADIHIDPSAVDDAWELLNIMTKAQALVGANSTLSWWGAFLGRRPFRNNVFPRRWFSDSRIPVRDLLLPEWKTDADY